MTSYVTVIRYERVEGQHADWAIWVNERSHERIWLYANDLDRFPIGKTFQI